MSERSIVVLTLKHNGELGPLVRQVRIEGGYGNSIFEILKRTPYVVDLCVSTSLWSDETAAGYLKGLSLVNPRRVIIHDDDAKKSSGPRKKVYEALSTAAKANWSNIVGLYIA